MMTATATNPAAWAPPGRCRGRRTGRAGIDREGTEQAGGDAAGAHPEEVPIEVDRLTAAVGEGAGRGRGLADDHPGHDGSDGG